MDKVKDKTIHFVLSDEVEIDFAGEQLIGIIWLIQMINSLAIYQAIILSLFREAVK